MRRDARARPTCADATSTRRDVDFRASRPKTHARRDSRSRGVTLARATVEARTRRRDATRATTRDGEGDVKNSLDGTDARESAERRARRRERR